MRTDEETRALVKKVQKVIFGIMCDIDEFCREHEITYFLSGGTCLGAVRHQGFIPWDDDADLMMPRPDYEKFLKLFPDCFGKKYGIGAFSLMPEWQRQYIRIWDKKTLYKQTNLNDVPIGICVEIFPIDGLPDNELVRKIHYGRVDLLRAMGNACAKAEFLEGERYRLVKKVAGTLLRPLGKRFFTVRMENIAKKYRFASSEYVGAIVAAHYGERETIKRPLMSEAVYLKFEDRDFPVPKGYHVYLSNLYGDYMVIPKGASEKGFTHLSHYELTFLD